jgi:hypothetical protein
MGATRPSSADWYSAGAAIANGGYYYAPGPYYYRPGPVYYGPRCYWSRHRVWNGYRWRRVRVCD